MLPETRVDWRASVGLVGTVVKYLAVAVLLPLAVAVWYGRDVWVFATTLVAVLLLGIVLERVDPDPDLGKREAFLMVGLTWLVVGVVGTLPYLLAGYGTASTLATPVNAFFESMSGFTTTGATVMGEIGTDRHSHALLMWRQLTQWLGGMGIVVLAVAILPELSVGGAQLIDAEAPGPGIEKLTPRIAETARVLWLVYLVFTVLEMCLLYGLHVAGFAPEMGLYDAVAHPLTTMPTGGFSPRPRSIAAFAPAVQWVILPFMFAAGVNFALFWWVARGRVRRLYRDGEFRFYLGTIIGFSLLLAGFLATGAGLETVPGVSHLEASIRHATFQAVAIVTTTGYASTDFETWSQPAKYLLLVAMFVGASAGSTGGSIKIVRWLVVLKSVRRELFTAVHPEAVSPVRLGGRTVDERALRGIYVFTLFYVGLFALGVVVVFLDAARVGLDLSVLEAASAVAATLGNVGPGFGIVGPMGSYQAFSPVSKLVMVFLMWAGRLEIFPVLVLLTRAFWRT